MTITLGLDRDAAAAIAALQYVASSDKMRPILGGLEISWPEPDAEGRLVVTITGTDSYVLATRDFTFNRDVLSMKAPASGTYRPPHGEWVSPDTLEAGSVLIEAKALAKALKAVTPRRKSERAHIWLDLEPDVPKNGSFYGSATVRDLATEVRLDGVVGTFPTWRTLLPDPAAVTRRLDADEGLDLPALNSSLIVQMMRAVGPADHIPLRFSFIRLPGKKLELQPVVYEQVHETTAIPTRWVGLQMPVRL